MFVASFPLARPIGKCISFGKTKNIFTDNKIDDGTIRISGPGKLYANRGGETKERGKKRKD